MSRCQYLAVLFLAVRVLLCAPVSQEVTGIVVDAASGEPIQHARVTAAIYAKSIPHVDALVVLTGRDGRFRFTNLPEGQADIRAQKAGYFDPVPNTPVFIGPGMSAVPLELRLTAAGVVNVRVSDDRGSSVSGAQVCLYAAPLPVKTLTWNVETDSEGMARVALPAGAYRIQAVSPGTGTLLRAQERTFPPVYYPGTVDPVRAESLVVAPGQEHQVELHVAPMPAKAIRGRLDAEGALFAVSVHPVGDDDYHVVWGIPRFVHQSRSFQVFGLTPGIYVLELSVDGFGRSYRQIVQVLDADVTEVVISEADRLSAR